MIIVDTNVLMDEQSVEKFFEEFETVHIPIEVIAELDNLKTKEGKRGFQARNAIRNIVKNENKIEYLIHDEKLGHNRLTMLVDDIILEHCKIQNLVNSVTLYSNDLNMRIKARAYGINSLPFEDKGSNEEIKAVHTVTMFSEDYKLFLSEGEHELLKDVPRGQYAEIKDGLGKTYAIHRKLKEGLWVKLDNELSIKSYAYDVTAKDSEQKCAIDSLKEDEFTVITGPAGTGKTLLSLGECLRRMYSMGSTIHIFVNPVKTRDTEELGYYPGDRNEKLLSSFIGGVLSSKLGDPMEVERLMHNGGLRVYPFSDIRGIEIPTGDVMYITEAQNLSIDLIKLAIQRCADGTKLIIEGDAQTQVDKRQFEGYNNGLQRVIEVYTGTETCDFGYVHLPNIYRSRMAKLAEEL